MNWLNSLNGLSLTFIGVVWCGAQLKLPQIQKIMMEFEKQSEIMDMKEEMMNDAIDDAMGDEDDEEERFVGSVRSIVFVVVVEGMAIATYRKLENQCFLL